MNRVLWTIGLITAIAAVALGIWAGERTIAMNQTWAWIEQTKHEMEQGLPRYPGSDLESDQMTRAETLNSNLTFFASIESARNMLAMSALTLAFISVGSFLVAKKRNAGKSTASVQ